MVRNGFSQTPQLSASQAFDADARSAVLDDICMNRNSTTGQIVRHRFATSAPVYDETDPVHAMLLAGAPLLAEFLFQTVFLGENPRAAAGLVYEKLAGDESGESGGGGFLGVALSNILGGALKGGSGCTTTSTAQEGYGGAVEDGGRGGPQAGDKGLWWPSTRQEEWPSTRQEEEEEEDSSEGGGFLGTSYYGGTVIARDSGEEEDEDDLF